MFTFAKNAVKKILPNKSYELLRSKLLEIHDRYLGWKFHRRQEEFRVKLQNILSKKEKYKGIIVFPFSIGWDAELFQRPQQMALALAKNGYLVFYYSNTYKQKEIDEGFIEVSPNLFLTYKFLEYLVCEMVSDPILIIYTYHGNTMDHYKDPFIVYEMLDELDVFEGHTIEKLTQYHNALVQEADIVLGISSQLVDKLRKTRPDAILVTNGVEYDLFAGTPDHSVVLYPEFLKVLERGNPIIGYYGALARWLDYDLIRYAAEQLDGRAELVFIGPRYDLAFDESGVENIDNIHVIPAVDYPELPAYLDKFTVATIPFQLSELTHSVSPLKLFEYMAGGKPIVTTALQECLKYEGLLIAYSNQEFVEKVKEAINLSGNEDYISKIRKIGYENSWDSKAKELIEEIEKRYNSQ